MGHRLDPSRLRAAGFTVLFVALSAPLTAQTPLVHFEKISGLIYVDVAINGSVPLPFVFDTGTNVNTIAPRVAADLQLTSSGETISAIGPGRGEDLTGSYRDGVHMWIGNVDLGLQRVWTKRSELPIRDGGRAKGIVGTSGLLSKTVTFDYAAEQIGLIDESQYAPDPADKLLSISIEHDLPFVRLALGTPDGGTASGKFLIDTGLTAGPIILSPSFLSRHREFSSCEFADIPPAAGFGGEVALKEGKIPWVQIGEFRLQRMPALFSINEDGLFREPEVDGIIGAEILRRFKFAIDFPHARLYLHPNRDFNDLFSEDASGMRLIASASFPGRFEVAEITRNSPAASADIRTGDVVVKIDHVSTSTLKLTELQAMLCRPRQTYRLVILRSGKKVKARLKTRDRIGECRGLTPSHLGVVFWPTREARQCFAGAA